MTTYTVGSKAVIASGHRYGQPYFIVAVTKVTKTQIEVEGGARYLLNSGRKYGDDSNYASRLCTDTTVEEAEASNARVVYDQDIRSKANKISAAFERSSVSRNDEVVLAVYALLEAAGVFGGGDK